MKILRFQLCTIFVFILLKFDRFASLARRQYRIQKSSKLAFLLHKSHLNRRQASQHYSVYNRLEDSRALLKPLASTYSEYVKLNQTTEPAENARPIRNILAIETSFDDTCLAVVTSDGAILAEGRLSQKDIIQKYGGLLPNESKETHQSTIEPLFNEVMEQSGLKIEDIDEIAVTRGPGMEICLRIGYNFGLELSRKHNIPLVPENHIAAHCLSPMIKGHQVEYLGTDVSKLSQNLKFPYLCLLLSGAHSQIYFVEDAATFHLLCDTSDAFAGNVLDKCAKVLGLDVTNGGGAELEKAARQVSYSRFNFTVPNDNSEYLEFFFSGIQSQLTVEVKNVLKKRKVDDPKLLPRTIINELAFATQETVFSKVLYLVDRAIEITRTFFPINQIAVVGGVAANRRLKNKIFDLLYEMDDSVLFDKQDKFFRKTSRMANKFLRNDYMGFAADNPYMSLYEQLKGKVHTVEDLVHYLLNPELFPELLIPGRMKHMSADNKSKIYKGILYLYFELMGPTAVSRINGSIGRARSNLTLVGPSQYILDLIRSDGSTSLGMEMGEARTSRWSLYTTTPEYSGDNAVMIGFSLLLKHRLAPLFTTCRMGITGIKNQHRIEGDDVLRKWNLGARRNWELLADICKIDSLVRY